MTPPETKLHEKYNLRRYTEIFYVLFFCIAVSIALVLFGTSTNVKIYIDNPLLWYNLFEFISIIVSSSIFLIAFYTYYQNMNMRLVISGFTFLIVGLLDGIHVITYPAVNVIVAGNMPVYSVCFMMLSRLVNAIGFFLLVIIPEHKRNNMRRSFILSLSLLFIYISYFAISKCTNKTDPYAAHNFDKFVIITVIIITSLYAYNVYRSVKDYKNNNDPLYKTLACAFIIMFFSQIITIKISGLFDVRIIISHLFKIAAFILYFNIFYIHNIRRPYILLSKAKEELNGYTYELDRLVDKRTNELRQINKRLIADLEVAKGIQRSMIPTVFPENEYVSFSAGYIPAENLSGDFYNVFKIDESRYGIYIGDVSGHGVSAAMLTVFTFQKIQSLLEETGEAGMGIPSVVLKHLYDSFNAANFSEELYIVLLYGVYNIDTGIFSYASGGLNTAQLRLRPDGSIQELDSDGYAICKLGTLLKPKFANHQIMLFPGDKLILYTDGLVEALNDKNIPYSKERLKELIVKNRKWNAGHLADVILEDIQQYSKSVKDDITLLILDVLRPF